MTHAALAVILIPLAAAIIASIASVRLARVPRIAALASGIAHMAAVVITVARVAKDGGLTYSLGGWAAPVGIVLVADAFSIVFLLITAVGHVSFLLHGMAEEKQNRKGVWMLTEILVAALSGIALAGDLFNLFVFVELASVTSVGLIAHKQHARGAGAGFVYLVFASLSGSFLLIAVLLLYSATGVLTIAEIAANVAGMPRTSYLATTGLILASFGMKFGLIPLHFWQAPSYHAAGSSVSALLSGTAMTLYIYAVVRLLFHMMRVSVHFPQAALLITVLGCVNVVGGHLLGLAERDLKRLLAYSSVAHVGYMLLGFGAAASGRMGATAATAGLLHVVFHAVMKSALFYSGRRLIVAADSSAIAGLQGSARRDTVAFTAFFLASLAIVGVPPASGFVSKWRVAQATAAVAGVWPVLVVAVGTVISMIYYARVFHASLREGGRQGTRARTAGGPWRYAGLFTVTALGLATLVLGFGASGVEELLEPAAQALVDLEQYVLLVRGGP